MKASRLATQSALFIALMLGSLSLAAGDIKTARGGAQDLVNSRPPVDSPQPAEMVMNCPQCKDQTVMRTDYTARGANKPQVAVTTHLCDSCGTKLTLVGHGKQAKEIRTHTCAKCVKGS